MSITVRPDPAYPLGGHAHLVIEGAAADGPVSVSIMDPYDDRHLGPKGWQSAPVALGPYPAQTDGGALVVSVGPEVVDNVETFATLTVTAAGRSATLSWPDTVRTSPALAGGGGIGARTEKAQPAKPSPLKQEIATEKTPVVEPKKTVAEESMLKVDPIVTTDDKDDGKSRLPLLLAGLVALAALGVGAWWWLTQQPATAPVEVVATPPAPVVAPPPVAQGCAGPDLIAAAALPPAEGFAVVAACGAQGDAEQRFRVIDAAAQAGVAEAIAMIGRWWDPAEAAAVGSNFTSRDPGQAARYYREAVTAGHAPAEALLRAACAALNPDVDPTHEIARLDYCQ